MNERKINKIPPMHPVSERGKREGEMHFRFMKRADEILANEATFIKNDKSVKIGLEVEYSITNSDCHQQSENVRNAIISENSEFTDVELGAAQLELRTDPIDITQDEGITQVFDQLKEREHSVCLSAARKGSRVIKAGSNPFVLPEDIVRTNKQKYQDVPNFHNDNKRRGLNTVIGSEPIDVGDAAIIAVMNSVQANIEAKNFSDAIDKINRSLIISPIATALGANARFVGLRDTGMEDVRMVAWEISHDTRTLEQSESGFLTRVGLPGFYYKNMRDYLQRVSAYPFILHIPEHALEVSIGLYWNDARIKFINDSIVVEFRPVSTQPTPEENVAIMSFYVGRLLWSQNHRETLLPIELVRQNKKAAMEKGLDALIWTIDTEQGLCQLQAREMVNSEMAKAIAGLKENHVANIDWVEKEFAKLSARVQEGTLSSKVASHVQKLVNLPREAALIDAFEANGLLTPR